MLLAPVARFERAGLLAWPGIELEWDGSWVRRAANGYTKRANSLQCFDQADGSDARDRLAAATRWFTSRGLKPVVRTCPLESPQLTAALDGEGWHQIDRSHLYAMPLGAYEADGSGKPLEALDPAFLAAQEQLQNYDNATMAGFKALLGAMPVPSTGIVLYRDGAPVASGLMAIADGIVVTGNVVTSTAHRRQGLAAAMMRTGLAWARANGAEIAALNVQADNLAAKALYHGLGYTHQYDYHYRVRATA